MLANLAMLLGAGVAVLKLTDFLLSDTQKRALDAATLRLWDRLDSLKRRLSLTEWVRRTRLFPWFVAIAFTLLGLAGLVTGQTEEVTDPGELPAAILLPGAAAFYLAVGFGLGKLVVFAVNMKTSALWVVAITTVALCIAAFTFAQVEALVGRLGDNPATLVLALLIAIPFYAVILWLLAMLPLLLAWIASGILWAVEFIVRRIAEYPNGAVLAASTMFTLVIALMKALSG